MRLVLRISVGIDAADAPADGGEPSCDASPAPIPRHVFEPVLERELLELCPSLAACEEVELSLSLLPPDEIRELNREYRDRDEATDVLSFPLWEEDGRFAPDLAMGPVLSLGDVVICPEEAARLHPDSSEARRLCLLLAHSFLHLLAWDHDTEERQTVMWARQDALRAKLEEVLALTMGRP